jgi:putative nucleotidyltransferase with HDIG domain
MSETGTQIPATVLFVDDEENILRSVSRLFLDEPFAVMTASSGAEGLKLLGETGDIALIVSDQRMPGMTGVEFLEQARGVAPEAIRMVLTGYADITATIDAINRGGACRYLTKPWDDDMLVRTVREAVETYRLIRENRRLAALVEQQNGELQEWNRSLKERVLEQTSRIRQQNEDLRGVNDRLADTFNGAINAFAALMALREQGVQDHSRTVAELAEGISGGLGLPVAEIETIRTAALLHDIGKIGIPDGLLYKDPQTFTPEERAEYLLHAVRGQAALDGVEALREAGRFIRHHHERFDGLGGPDGLKGNDIPLGARIIALADGLDRRVTRASGSAPVAAALAEIRLAAGRLYDPALLPLLEKPAQSVYGSRAASSAEREQEVAPGELHDGMVLSRNVCSGTGLLLLNRGTLLTEHMIIAIKRYYTLDPPGHGVFIRREA